MIEPPAGEVRYRYLAWSAYLDSILAQFEALAKLRETSPSPSQTENMCRPCPYLSL